MATMHATKRPAAFSQGRVALLEDGANVDVGDINALVRTFREHKNENMTAYGIVGETIADIAYAIDPKKSVGTPHKNITEMLLCTIDKLGRGTGSYQELKDVTSRLYDDTHLEPRRGIRGVRTCMLNGYTYIELASYGWPQRHARVRIAMHRLMCWLRWGNPSSEESIVCHDPRCSRRECVGLACLRWGTNAINAHDRVTSNVLRRARLGRATKSDAQASESMLPIATFCVVWVLTWVHVWLVR